MSRSQGLYRPPDITTRPVVRRSRIWRPAVLALVAYALGLLPFYFLTPVHDALPKLVSPAERLVLSTDSAPIARPTPSRAEVKKRVGAESVSIAAPTAENAQDAVAVPSEVANDSRYAFLLLGYGGGGHDGAYLSDSMMVVIVDPDRKSLALVSIPRDSWVPMTFDGKTAVYNKLNTAYAFARDTTLYPDRLSRYDGDRGAGVFAADTVSRLVGVPIRYFMGIDFAGFRQMVDAVGGIDVDVPASFSARYPANDDPSIDPSWKTVRFAKGPEHMSGERAIEYARAREAIDNVDEGSDFARSRRQRLIIEAFKQRMLQPAGLVHLPQLVGLGSTHVDTNYSVPDVAGLSQLVPDWKQMRIFQTALTTDNYLEDATGPDGTYAIVPRSSTHTWAQIRGFMRRMWADPEFGAAVAGAHIVVENDTGVAGTASRATAVLTSLGYNVGPPISGPIRSASRIVDASGSQAALALVPALKNDLDLASLDSYDDTPDPTLPLVLQLGSNDVNARLVVAADDRASPASTVGIEKFGVWVPDVGAVVEDTPVVSTPVGTPVDSKHRTPTPTRGGVVTATPPDTAGRPSPSPSRPQTSPVATVAKTPTTVTKQRRKTFRESAWSPRN